MTLREERTLLVNRIRDGSPFAGAITPPPASQPRPVLPVPVGIAYRPNRFVAIPQLERRESPAVAGSDGSRGSPP